MTRTVYFENGVRSGFQQLSISLLNAGFSLGGLLARQQLRPLRFGALSLGDVDNFGHNARDVARGVMEGCGPYAHVDRRPVFATPSRLETGLGLTLHSRLHQRAKLLLTTGRNRGIGMS